MTVTVTTNPNQAVLSVFAVGDGEEQELVSRSVVLEDYELRGLTDWLESI